MRGRKHKGLTQQLSKDIGPGISPVTVEDKSGSQSPGWVQGRPSEVASCTGATQLVSLLKIA